MEHRLLTGGGEFYLPFARSRIKALRAVGLPYASQQFEIDGCSIKVRIEPGQDYIRIEGGSVAMQMDSGIVDVGLTGDNYPERYLPGTLLKPTPVLTYDTAFSKESAKAPWWVNPGETSAGQLSGEIAGGRRFVGKIRKDGVAKSFAPRNTMQGDPPVKTPDPADDALVGKKITSDLCPPSMFTGRARLYAQALFGQYLYDSKLVGRAEQSNSPPGLIAGAPPALQLSIHEDRNKDRAEVFKLKVEADRVAATAAGFGLVFQDPYNVTLNINSGVYLDPVSGKHWLLNPVMGKMIIYPLISSPAGEALRKWLRPSMAGELSAEDRQHLEAYILSACRPHVELRTVLTLDATLNPYSMGYGWHWNWSGTCADMVQNLYDTERQDGSSSSTHYRLSVTAAFDPETSLTTWAAATAVIEGPISWATYTPVCCFTNPTWVDRYDGFDPYHVPVYWSEKTPWKFGGYSVMYPSNAPIYAFYRKDELQVCRFRCQIVEKTPQVVRYTPGWAWHDPSKDDLSYTLTYETTGLDSAYLHADSGVSTHFVFSISCGENSVRVVNNKVQNINSMVESVKTEAGGVPGYDPEYRNAVGSFQLREGRPLADGSYAGAVYPGWGSATDWRYCNWTSDGFHEALSSLGVAGAMVPFYDAEAFYLIQDTWDLSWKTQRQTGTVSGIYIGYDHGWMSPWPYSDPAVYVGPTRYEIKSWMRNGGVMTPLPDLEAISNKDVQLKVSYAGGVAATSGPIPGDAMSMFEDGDENYVAATFKTLSSASFAPCLSGLINRNWPATMMARPAIVGWA